MRLTYSCVFMIECLGDVAASCSGLDLSSRAIAQFSNAAPMPADSACAKASEAMAVS